MIVVAFLTPLALYLLILGAVNRRRHPLMVSAAWDFAGLLFAASGFLTFGLPAILSGFSEHGRATAMFGRPGSGSGAWSCFADLFEGLSATLFSAGDAVVLLAYFVVVVAGSVCILWRRRSQTAVYNVHPEVFDEVLAGVLDAAGLSWSRAGNRYFIARPNKGRPADEEPSAPSPITSEPPLVPAERRGTYPASADDFERSAYLEVEPAPFLCHATLRWETADGDLRNLVETELRTALSEVRTSDNPTGAWLLTSGIALMVASVIIFGMVALNKMFLER